MNGAENSKYVSPKFVKALKKAMKKKPSVIAVKASSGWYDEAWDIILATKIKEWNRRLDKHMEDFILGKLNPPKRKAPKKKNVCLQMKQFGHCSMCDAQRRAANSKHGAKDK